MLLPFSEKARQAAQTTELVIDASAISAAKAFIGEVKSRAGRIELLSDLQQVKQFALCKVILSLCPYPIIADFASKYSMLWRKHFVLNVTDAKEFALEIFPSIHFNSECTVGVFDYLAAEESLTNMRVSSGTVHLSTDELNDVLARQVKRKVMSIPNSTNLPNGIKEAAEELASYYAATLPKGSKNLERQDIKKIRSGLQEGGRFYGCMKLSRACFRDNLSFEEARQIILEYVKACSPGKSPFTEKEAFTCLEWVYRKGQKLVGS